MKLTFVVEIEYPITLEEAIKMKKEYSNKEYTKISVESEFAKGMEEMVADEIKSDKGKVNFVTCEIEG